MTRIFANALLAQGEAMLANRDLAQAIECLCRAETAGADRDRCSAGLWTAHMLSGQFELAWRQNDALRRRGSFDPNRMWQGRSLAGKRVMLRCLHGFGDAVQFLRYAPRLRALASSLVVEVPPRFMELAQWFEGVDDVITWGSQAPLISPAYDEQIEIMELPYIFRTQLTDLPLATKYLRIPIQKARRSEHLRVGLSLSAGSWNPARAVSPELLEPVLAMGGCEIWDLRGGPDHMHGPTPTSFDMLADDRCRQSIDGLAAIISQMDLVITVDTLAAHLAGALGVSVWVMLPYQADWRWMHGRSDSPWYPTVRLFRQPKAGDWESVVADVCQALKAATASPVYCNEAVEA